MSPRTRSACAVAVLLAVLASTPAAADPVSAAAGEAAAGSFDLATVEELAFFFADESYRRLRIPVLLRLVMIAHGGGGRKEAIEDLLADPPRADAEGVVYPFGAGNDLSFAFDPETRTLTAWERMTKKRGTVGFMGMTAPEHAAALNASSRRQADRGGADWAHDPIRDALSLKRVYRHPPTDRERFYQEIDRLIATRRKWAKKRYLRETIALAESRLPPASASAATDGFSATLVLRHFSVLPEESQFWVDRYFRAWDRKEGRQAPRLVSDRELERDRRMYFFIHFQGATDGENGVGQVEASFRLFAPDGSVVFEGLDGPIWQMAVMPPDHLQIGVNNTFFKLQPTRSEGTYRLEAEVCDAPTDRCVELTHSFELRAG